MKHLRKNDGYVLVYVLIVFAVLSFVLVSICTMALKNLQAQEMAVRQMETRYEAEGYLQQFVAGVEALTAAGTGGPSLDAAAAKNAAMEKMQADFLAKVRALENGQLAVQDPFGPEMLVVRAVSMDETVQIDASFAVALDYELSGGQLQESDPVQYSYTCTLRKAVVQNYASYHISYGEVLDETQ